MRNTALAVFVIMIVLVAACTAAVADTGVKSVLSNATPDGNDIGYLFNYECDAWSPGTYFVGTPEETSYDDWFYDYWLENNSTEFQIVSWVWQHGSDSGNVMPVLGHDVTIDSCEWPLDVCSGPTPGDTTYREESFSDAAGKVLVTSYVEFDDGHKEYVDIYVPSSLVTVPEPGSLLAMASGLIGLLGIVRRRRA